jgi:(p)ppGpp synthase/HD superfamily hydrolase
MDDKEFIQLLKLKNISTPTLKQALSQAYKSHSAQKRFDGNTVYLGHILPVAIEVIESYQGEPISEVAVATALLHDAVEDDSSFSELQLRKDFSEEIADNVMILTKPPKDNEHEVWGEEFFTATQRILKKLETSSQEARIVKLADRTINLMTIDDFKLSRPDDFNRFVTDTIKFFLPFAEKYSPYFYKKIKNKLDMLAV